MRSPACPTSGTNGNTLALYGTSYSSSATYAGGTIYYPYPQVSPTCTGTGAHCANSGTATGFTVDLVSGGGHIVAYNLTGQDTPPMETVDDPGANYTVGDVLAVPALGGSGSNATLTVTQICSNAIAPVTNAASGINNVNDASGTNASGWPDPNRTAGSYVAAHATAFGVSANVTFIASIAPNGVMTVSSTTGGLSPGDAITFSGQTNAAFIKYDSTNDSVGNACGGSTCTGNNGSCTTGCTYLIAGATNVSSTTMSSWTSQQLLNLMDNKQSKQTWNTALVAPAINAYIQQGFNMTAAVTSTSTSSPTPTTSTANDTATATSAPAPASKLSISISSPTNGALIRGNGSVNIASSASDTTSIQKITIKGDDNVLYTCTGVHSCATTWQGKNISKGTHVISATATDSFGSTSSASITILDLK